MAKIREITSYLENIAPLAYQEDYDNSGLLTGNPDTEVSNVLISLDCTENVVQEAIDTRCNLIIAHHPIIFRGLKSLTGKNYIERTIIKAIKNDIAIYAIHTNLDNVQVGVNQKIAAQLGLQNTKILLPKKQTLSKLTTFIPKEATEKVLQALHDAGAGNIGNYQNCSFSTEGTGTFRPNELANPTIGQVLKQEQVHENRVELIFPSSLKNKILSALKSSHPYEEVAYYLHALENTNQEIGSGMIGTLENEMGEQDFLGYLKEKMQLQMIRFTPLPLGKKIGKVAVCGGSGSFLLREAIAQGAQAFVTADFKYHEFFDAENRILIADIGHYESEVFTKDLLHDILKKKFTSFALCLSKTVTNPIRYF